MIIHSLLNLDIDLDTKHIKSFRTSKIKFECNEDIGWTIDGEFGGKCKTAEIKSNHKAIDFLTDTDDKM